MASPYWKNTAAGSTSWATAGNWQGGVPASTDTPSIFQGSADINTGLNQSAVTLGAGGLTVTSGFTGTAAESTVEGASLQINSPLFHFMRAFIGGTYVEGGTTRFRINPGTVTPCKVVVDTTGAPADNGMGAVSLTAGGTTTGEVDVNGGTVDLAGRAGDTFTLNRLNVSGGVVIVGAGVTFGGTTPKIVQDDGVLVLSAGVATLSKTGGTVYTNGTGAITTATVDGECHFSHRPTGDAFTDLTVKAGGVVIFDEDPRGLTIANVIQAYAGARIRVFGKAQVNVAGTGGLKVHVLDGGPGDVVIEGADDDCTFALS
jgi:hypothetical protein